MNFLERGFIKGLTICRNIYPGKQMVQSIKPINYSSNDANRLIKEKLLSNSPCMICRFGASELFIMVMCDNMKKGKEKYFEYINSKIDSFWYNEKRVEEAFYDCGLFPVNKDIFFKFNELMLEDMKMIDILGSWLKEEVYYEKELAGNLERVQLRDLEPYYHSQPWSEALAEKKILVIHPYAKSIQDQYLQRAHLFSDKKVLPEFDLITIKAVQSLGNSATDFDDWFAALNHMKDQINKTPFDIAIIGCGAYGFPLAAHVKRIGKKSIHLGGATQALFGIIGKRWEENEVAKFINEHWVRPLDTEINTNKKYLSKHGYI